MRVATCFVSGSIKLFSITKQSWDTCRVSSLIDFIYFQNFLLFPVNDSSKGQLWYFTNRVRPALPWQNVTRLTRITRRTRPSFNAGSDLCLHDVYKLKNDIYVLKSILFSCISAKSCKILRDSVGSCRNLAQNSCKIPLDLAGVQEKRTFSCKSVFTGRFVNNRVASRTVTRDVTSVMKSLPWGKTAWASYGKRALFVVACLLKRL